MHTNFLITIFIKSITIIVFEFNLYEIIFHLSVQIRMQRKQMKINSRGLKYCSLIFQFENMAGDFFGPIWMQCSRWYLYMFWLQMLAFRIKQCVVFSIYTRRGNSDLINDSLNIQLSINLNTFIMNFYAFRTFFIHARNFSSLYVSRAKFEKIVWIRSEYFFKTIRTLVMVEEERAARHRPSDATTESDHISRWRRV